MNTDSPSQPLEALLNEVSSALADMAKAAEDGQVTGAEISATLIEMRELMAKRQASPPMLDGVVEAIKALRLDIAPAQVTVQNQVEVLPTPIQNTIQAATPVVQILERAAPVDYEMRVQYDTRGRIETAQLTAVKTRTKGIAA